MKTFTAQVRVGDGALRQRRRPLQEGGRAGRRRDGVRRDRRRPRRRGPRGRARPPSRRRGAPTARLTDADVPELPEVEVVRAGLERHVARRHRSPASTSSTRAPCAATRGGPTGFAAALTGRRIEAARRRGKYLWLPLDNGDALLGHLGMSGQLLVQPPGAPDERHLRVRLVLEGADEGRELRFVDQRMFGGLSVSAGGAELPAEIAHIARDPLDPQFDDDEFVRRVRRRTLRDQAAAARPDPGLGRRQHLRRRGAVAGAAPRRAAGGAAHRAARSASCSGTPATVMTDALGQGGTSLRRALRQRQRRVGLLRPLAARLRPRGRAVRPLRHPDPAGRVHEPVVVLLPVAASRSRGAAAPRRAPAFAARRLTRTPVRCDS